MTIPKEKLFNIYDKDGKHVTLSAFGLAHAKAKAKEVFGEGYTVKAKPSARTVSSKRTTKHLLSLMETYPRFTKKELKKVSGESRYQVDKFWKEYHASSKDVKKSGVTKPRSHYASRMDMKTPPEAKLSITADVKYGDMVNEIDKAQASHLNKQTTKTKELYKKRHSLRMTLQRAKLGRESEELKKEIKKLESSNPTLSKFLKEREYIRKSIRIKHIEKYKGKYWWS